MKISGPKGPSKPTAPDGPKSSKKPTDDAVGFDKVLRGEAEAAPQPQPPLVVELAARLRAGEITPAAAAQQLMSEVVQRRGASLSPAQRKQLDEALHRLLADDPLIANKLRDLSRSDGGEQ